MEPLRRTILVASLVVAGVIAGVVLRFLFTDLPDFAPVGALALFAGASVKDKRIAVILPLIVMIITDSIIGFHDGVLWIYAAMLVYAGLGMWAGNGMRLSRLVPATLAGSVSFFLITNFGFFIGYCPKTWHGFIQCYIDALPFFRNTMLSDILFSAIFFSALAFAERFSPQFSMTTAASRD